MDASRCRSPGNAISIFGFFAGDKMAGARIPGPIGSSGRPGPLDDGTPFGQISVVPGPIGMSPPEYVDVPGQQAVEREQAPAPVESRTLKGRWRPLTDGEIAMARTIFQDSIDYTKVKVHNEEYLWFGMQPDEGAIAPNGEMYFGKVAFREDFSQSEGEDQHLFIHEMVHVWQYQLGYPVKLRGAIRIGLSYEYTLESGKRLSDYNMEAQGDLLADYWAVKYQSKPIVMTVWKYKNSLKLFEEVLSVFLANPKDISCLPGGNVQTRPGSGDN